MAHVDAEKNLLFGLIALQIGLIDQSKLIVAFQAWTLDKARGLADHLVLLGDLDADDRAAVEALVERHLKKHGGDVERSLAAIPPAGPPAKVWRGSVTPRSTPPWTVSAPAQPRATPTAPPAMPSARPPRRASGSASCGPMPRAAWAPSSSRWTPSCTARWRSSRSSTTMPMIRPA